MYMAESIVSNIVHLQRPVMRAAEMPSEGEPGRLSGLHEATAKSAVILHNNGARVSIMAMSNDRMNTWHVLPAAAMSKPREKARAPWQ